jgi:hypothetical protein
MLFRMRVQGLQVQRGLSSTSGYDGSGVQSSEETGECRAPRLLPYIVMPLYFMLHDAERFHELIRPVLAASWRQRGFAPCEALRSALTAEMIRFLSANRIREEESILLRVGSELPFGREMWRYLVGEVLLVAAAELPEIHVPEETLCRLAQPADREPAMRDRSQPMEQVLHGARDLNFGGGWYRPDAAGWNDTDDVIRLTAYLAALNPQMWTPAKLPSGDENDEDRQEEVEFARESLVSLRAMYERARTRGQILVCELL